MLPLLVRAATWYVAAISGAQQPTSQMQYCSGVPSAALPSISHETNDNGSVEYDVQLPHPIEAATEMLGTFASVVTS
jgi:hypothetical protein